MAEPMILELLSNLKTRVSTNEVNIATNTSDIATNRADFDTHTANDVRHWTATDRQNFDRVVHFKGYFTTRTKLEESYPTGEVGDYAIVGATDTVWAWDDTTNSWLNTTEQGIVISVNGRTGEVILTKTDVGLSNVDNTADNDKPVSTAQQNALNNKVDRKTITEAEVDSVSLRAGIYYLNLEKTILDYTDDKWTVIVGEEDEKSINQLWITARGDGTKTSHIFIRRLINDGTSERWSDFQELMTNVNFTSLSTKINDNTNNISNLQNDKADRKDITLTEADSINLGSGIYFVEASKTILGYTDEKWTVVVGGHILSSGVKSLSQIWMNVSTEESTHIYIRHQNASGWGNFVELISTDIFSIDDISKAKQYKGYFVSVTALKTTLPTGTAGDYAVVEDSFFIWSIEENDWVQISGGGGGGAVTSVNNKTGDVVLTKNDIGLTNVDNTADADKEVKSAESATNDDLGNKISDTYVKKSGDTMTGDLTLEKGKIKLTTNSELSYDKNKGVIYFYIDGVVVATLNSNGVFNANKFTENVGGIDTSGGGSGTGKSNLPLGTVLIYPSEVIPDGWLLCDGQEISRVDYEDLFALLGTTYGAGNGSTTFNLPNFKQRTPVGYDADSDIASILGLKDGEKEHTLTVGEIPSNNVDNVEGVYIESTGNSYTQLTGTAEAHNNMQPYIVQNFIIKVTADAQGSGTSDITILNSYSDSVYDVYSANYVNQAIETAAGFIFQWDGNNSETNTENIELWQNIYNKQLEYGVIVLSKKKGSTYPNIFYIPKEGIGANSTTQLKGLPRIYRKLVQCKL